MRIIPERQLIHSLGQIIVIAVAECCVVAPGLIKPKSTEPPIA